MVDVVRLRLGAATIGRLPADIRRPAYDRSKLTPGILHLGVGAFHRCHQAEWTDDALEAEFGAWGIVGVNLRPPDIAATLGPQDGYYVRILREAGQEQRRLIGSEIGSLSVGDASGLARALGTAADPAIRVVTMTVTEKGYCHIPATGELDRLHPDIVHDAADPAHPVSVPGFVLRLLALRHERRLPLPTLISCDNVPDNGDTLRTSVLTLAEMVDPALARTLRADAVFLNTMVDRIVPATQDADIARFAAETGLDDHGLVVGEPFRMWVIERKPGAVLPPWDKAGALVVDDVAPYEILKMRVLNGVQSNVCQLGLLSEMTFMSDVMGEAAFEAFARRTIAEEVMPHLPPVPGIDPAAYLDDTIRRLRNPDLRHATLQISTDGSRKIKQRLLQPIRAALAAGTPHGGLLLGVAGWMKYASGRTWRGETLDVRDPLADTTKRIAAETAGDGAAFVRAMLGLDEVFGQDLRRNTDLVGRLCALMEQLDAAPAIEAVRAHLRARPSASL